MASYCPGYRFHPTDEELVLFYLKRKLSGRLFRLDPIGVIDIYKFEPWDLPSMSKQQTRDLEWYFFTVLDKKYRNGSSSRTNRATDRGYWKTTGNDRPVKRGDRIVGMKKTLVYHGGRAPRGNRQNWVMHEYRMADEELARFGTVQEKDAYVVCRIFQKSGSGPKNGEKYGAPLKEDDWERDDHVFLLPAVDDQVAPLPAIDDQVAPLPAVDDQVAVAPLPAAVDNEPSNEGSASAGSGYVEVADLDEKLDIPSSFYYGECSSHPGLFQALIDDQEPVEGTYGVYQPYNMAEQYSVDNGELSHNENPLNFNCALDGPDLYLDATGYPPIPDDVPYMEANDLVNQDESNPTVTDPSDTEMLDEYLAFPDEDIFNYISFDSPQNTGSESPIANHEQPSIEQNVEGETNDSSLANKHIFEAQSSNAASSKQNSEASNLVSGDTNPFVKQANKLLASIPAAPAFASEFPTKEFALGLHPAAQSSNSAHVTAGMISITDITFRGNAMDWMVGKNGGFNAIVSTGFPQPDVNPAALVPISGLICSKTAFVLSHGWIFLMGFSVLILSLSFKIGSFMYTGK